MPRDILLHIEDILSSIEKIKKYAAGMDFETFAGDTKTQDAVVRNLEIIGEAVRILPDEVKEGKSSVDWRKIVGLRNILVHEYFGVSLPIIWDVVINKLDSLENACKEITEEMGG